MFGRRRLKLSVAQAIITEEHLKIKASGGSIADAELASFNRLKEAGFEDLAGLLILYHTSLMDVKPPKGDISVTVQGSTGVSVAFDSEVGNITTTVNNLAKQGGESADFATALKKLTEAVASSAELTAEQKKGILESLELVGEQAEEAPEKRKKAILQPVLDNIPKLFSIAASLASLWHTLGPNIVNFFK